MMADQVTEPLTERSTPTADELRRAEAKPPLYRFFRGTLYVLYMVVTVWLCLAIAIAVWRSVWGEPGRALRQHEASTSTTVPQR